MLFINFARCRSFDSADLMRNATIADANDNIDLSNIIRECENISLLGMCVCMSSRAQSTLTQETEKNIKD